MTCVIHELPYNRVVAHSGPRFVRLAHRMGGTRMLALPLLRALAVLAGAVWVFASWSRDTSWAGVHVTLLAFFGYSVGLIAALARWPHALLRHNRVVLAVDVAFALLLIRFTGGPTSSLFLALLLIVGVQAYYYGLRRGLFVAAGAGSAYALSVWPDLGRGVAADVFIQVLVLGGTALGVGLIGQAEDAERFNVATLSGEAQARERFIRSVLDNLYEGVVALDTQGRITAWNRAMEERCGLPAAAVLGQRLLECVPTYGREAVAGPLGSLLRGEASEFTLEAVEHETARGERVVQNLKGRILRDGGRPAGAVLLVQDVTGRVALERSARQAEKLAAVGTLAAGLAHELNNPIGIISSRIEIMLLEAESQALPPAVLADLHVLHRHAQRVGRIAQGLLSFSRWSPGVRGTVDVNVLVEDTMLLIEEQLARKRIVVKRSLAPWLPPVEGDANALQQVVLNLVTNARDVLTDGGEISIGTAPVLDGSGGAVRLTVRDNGPGIPPEVLPRIFDPFFTTKPDGTGLGLSISYGIVKEHGGTIEVQSRPGEGTAFVLTLPARGGAR
jgi:PAS domain S-box-containing protein